MPSSISITRWLAETLPSSCGVANAWVTDHPAPLPVEELAGVVAANSRRKAEFAAGRCAARAALRKIGVRVSAIPIRSDRAPGWPSGIVGSISHTSQIAVAAVAPATELISIGLDVEDASAVGRDLWPELFVESERRMLERLPAGEQGTASSMLFSMKEAFFKFQFPITGQWLDFRQVEIIGESNDYTITPDQPLIVAGRRVANYRAHGFSDDDLVGTLVFLASAKQPAPVGGFADPERSGGHQECIL